MRKGSRPGWEKKRRSSMASTAFTRCSGSSSKRTRRRFSRVSSKRVVMSSGSRVCVGVLLLRLPSPHLLHVVLVEGHHQGLVGAVGPRTRGEGHVLVAGHELAGAGLALAALFVLEAVQGPEEVPRGEGQAFAQGERPRVDLRGHHDPLALEPALHHHAEAHVVVDEQRQRRHHGQGDQGQQDQDDLEALRGSRRCGRGRS